MEVQQNSFHEGWFEDDRVISPLVANLVKLARAGKLGKSDIEEILNDPHSYRDTSYRNQYVAQCSWAIYTKKWIHDVAKLVQGKRVVEVCCGRGVLGPIMQKLGVDWICTDLIPPAGEDHVIKMDALKAATTLDPDIVFASWVPYREVEFDYEIASRGIPMLLVGESHYGNCGSKKFWGSWLEYDDNGDEIHDATVRDYDIVHLFDAWKFDGRFHDVPCWRDMHDQTVLVIPRGHHASDYFNVGI